MFCNKIKKELKLANEGLKIREKELKAMQGYIDKKEDEIHCLEKKIVQKDKRIKELEAECEFLFNNLTPKKRETINADKKAK